MHFRPGAEWQTQAKQSQVHRTTKATPGRFNSIQQQNDFILTRNNRWAEVPNRALTISKNVRAPFAFSFTFDATTEKNMSWTLSLNSAKEQEKVTIFTYVPQTPYHHPPATPN